MWRWARDKRRYRFVQDTRFGRKVLAESNDIAEIVEAITHYVAARIIERERALAEDEGPLHARLHRRLHGSRRRSRWRMFRAFVFGLIAAASRCSRCFGSWRRGCRISGARHANSGWRLISPKLAAAPAARNHGAAPRAPGALDLIEVVAGGFVVVARRARGRRHAEHGNAELRPRQPVQRRLMVMAVQHQLGAVLAQHVAERAGIGQPAEIMRALDRRMMDQDDAERLLALELRQQLAEPGESDRRAAVRSRRAAASAATSKARSAPAGRAAARRESLRRRRRA